MSILFEITLKQGVDVLRWGNNDDEDILVVAPWCFLIAQKSHDDIFGDHIEARRRCFEMEFNDLFDSPRPGLFVFCERVREEASHWVRLHEDALKGNFKHRQKRSEVAWPKIPSDFDEWALSKKRRTQGK
jgi:hypothetical protein